MRRARSPAAELNTRTWFEPLARLAQAHACRLHQGFGGLRIARVDGDADIHPDLHLQAARGHELRERAQQARAQLIGAVLVHHLRHPDREFVPCQARQEVVRLQRCLGQRPGILCQDIVGAHLEDLVDLAKIGDMHQQHGAAGFGKPRLRDRLV